MLKRLFTMLIWSVLLMMSVSTSAQTVITRWNFNGTSATTVVGGNLSPAPSEGTGTASLIGGATSPTSFPSGTVTGGSSDPVTSTPPNYGWGVTTFPTQGTANQSAGVQFAVSTAGMQNIIFGFDNRFSNTAPRHFTVQYTTDITASSPIWINVATDSIATGTEGWLNGRTYNLSSVSALNNNANVGFRVVASFRPNSTNYIAASNTTSFSSAGTWRFDMVTISGTSTSADVTAPIASSYRTVSATQSWVRFNEPLNLASATNVANYSFSPSLTINNISLSNTGDTVFISHNALNNGIVYSLGISGVQDLALNTMTATSFNNILWNSSIPNLVITEIAHTPNDYEYVEVLNNGSTAVNLGGLKFAIGIGGNLPSISLAPGAVAVFSSNASNASTQFGFTVYPFSGGLSSGGEAVIIQNSLNQTIDSVFFGVSAPWPVTNPAPSGYTSASLELINSNTDNTVAANWQLSYSIKNYSPGPFLGTPGIYPPPAPSSAPIALEYTLLTPTTSFVRFNTAITNSSATNASNFNFSPALNISNRVLGINADTVFLTHDAFANGVNYTLTINNIVNTSNVAMTQAATFTRAWNSITTGLVITEFAHSPNTMEFIEVYNASPNPINVNGLRWVDGTTGNFPDTVIASGGNILFSTQPVSAAALLGGQKYYLINNGLGSSSDRLIIMNSANQVVDSVEYFVGTNGWPAAATGVHAYSFELVNATLNNAIGSNWVVPNNIIASSSGTILATPGLYPPPAASGAPQALNFTILSNTQTRIVFNQSITPSTATNINRYLFSPSLQVNAVSQNANGDTLVLNHAAFVDGQAYVLTIDSLRNASNIYSQTATFNLVWNQSNPNLVITEIVHSPNDIEYIEIFNAGATPIALGGLRWTDGTAGNFPNATLNAGQAVIFSTSSTAGSILGVNPVYTITSGLGSSNDILVIRNSLNQVIDSVSYFVGSNGWPSAPTGVYAYSFELINASVDNNVGSSWVAPLNPITPQPSQGVIRATPNVYPTPAFTPANATISFVGGQRTTISETVNEVRIIANLQGGGAQATSIDLEVIPYGNALAGQDFILPSAMTFNWAANANNVNDTIVIAISNDNLSENTEYFVVRFTNPVGIALPNKDANHFTVFIQDDDLQAPQASQELTLNHLSSFSNGTAGQNSAEIVAHDPATQRLFIANSIANKLDIVNFSNPSAPVLLNSISLSAYGNINSVAVKNGIVALAIENANPQANGSVVFMNTSGAFVSQVNVGAMPDMITFNHAGNKVLTANEGEPNTAYTTDPEGSVSVIDISGGIANVTQANVTTIGFASFNTQISQLRQAGVRIFGPNATVAQDLEPEYITISANDQTAWVACQENNALAVINLSNNTVSQILPLGTKDHQVATNALDPSDQGGQIHISSYPVKGVYMPDAIASYQIGGITYIVTANEGDAREYNGYSEILRASASNYILDTVAFPFAHITKAHVGRLNVTTASGDTDMDGDFDEIHVYGARSFSIWNGTTGALVWDSGRDMELITSKHPTLSAIFNASNANNTFKNRSDDKGPEPEGVTIAEINGKHYAFVSLERIGGCMIYDVTNPNAPVFVDYKNTRNVATYGGDNGAEGLLYIPSNQSPNGKPLVLLANEVSSTLTTYEIQAAPLTVQILHASDFEAGVNATKDAPHFAAVVDHLEDTYPTTLVLSSGDNILPSPFSNSGEDPSLQTPLRNAYINYYGGTFANNDLRAGIGRVDMTIMNIIGIDAAALGNHEFDWGTSELRNMIAGVNSGTAIRWFGVQFPYLSANLNFANDANLSNLFEPTIKPHTFFKSNPTQTAAQIAATRKLAKSATITKNGVKFGIVGATTPQLAQISSPGATQVLNPGAGTNNMVHLASIIQPVVDSLRMKENVNKIVLLAHLQQLSLEVQLASLLRGVDVIIAGGSHTLLSDGTDRLRHGDVSGGAYPIRVNDLDGKQTVIVNTASEYKYVGRLVLSFDINGDVIPSSIDSTISGAYAADSIMVAQLWGNYNNAFATGTKGKEVRDLTQAISTVIAAKDGNIFGKTAVFLEGRRERVRTEETNLGNITADANLWQAKQADPLVSISIKNGGGIRAQIGDINATGSIVTLDPPKANPQAGKLQGDISQLDIENALRFNNRLSVLNLTASNLKAILEHGVAQTAPGATPGRFPQVSGIQFSYDATLPVNSRIRNAVVLNNQGNYADTIVQNGMVYGNPTRNFRIVTLNFLAGGGDGYPFNTLGTGRYDLDTVLAASPGQATFTVPGSEQDAFAEYMKLFHSVTPYNKRDTAQIGDVRIQNISARPDCILSPVLAGNVAGDTTVCAGTSITLSAIPAGGTYVWNNNATTNTISVNTSGSFFADVTLNGCKARTKTKVVTLRNLPTVTASSNANNNTICSGSSITLSGNGANTYSWTNNVVNNTPFIPAASGNYSVTGTDIFGCTNTAQITVNLNALPNVTAISNNATNTLCSGQSITLNGQGAISYSWNNNITNNQSFIPSSTTTYTVIGTDANNCSNTAQITVTVNPLPTVTANVTNNNPCSGQTITLTGAGAQTYSWNNGAVNNVPFAATTTTTYTVTGTDANNCSNTSQVTVTVKPLPNVIAAASSTNVCSGDQVTLFSFGNAATYAYNFGVQPNVPFVLSNTTTFTLTGTGANGCTKTAQVTVNTNPLPIVGASASSAQVCEGGQVTLTGSGANSYTWNNGVINGVAFMPSATNTYTVTGTNALGCKNTAQVTVVVNQNPIIDLGADQNSCNLPVTLNAGNQFASFLWSTGATTSSIQANSTGFYSVVATDVFGCSGVDTVYVKIVQVPTIDLGPNQTICVTGSVNLSAPAGFDTYLWSNGATSQSIVLQGNNLSIGQNTVSIVAEIDGCLANDELVITVNPCTNVESLSLDQDILVMPNPAKQAAQIQFGGKALENGFMSVFNTEGKLMVEQNISGILKTTIDLSNYSNGLYFIHIQSNMGSKVIKLIKE